MSLCKQNDHIIKEKPNYNCKHLIIQMKWLSYWWYSDDQGSLSLHNKCPNRD